MASIKIIINGTEHTCGYELIKALAENLPEERAYDALAEDMLGLGIPSVAEVLVSRESLGMSRRDALWEGGDIDIRRALVRCREFLSLLTDKQAQDIINDNDPSTLQEVAGAAELLFQDPRGDEEIRLSLDSANKLIEHIVSHEDPSVWEDLDIRSRVLRTFPSQTLALVTPLLKKRILRFAWNAGGHLCLKEMKDDDVSCLDKAPRCALEHIASNIEDIHDRRVRLNVAKKLASQPDPLIRLALASNAMAPGSVLGMLASDSDVDVAAAATAALEEA